MPGEPGNKRANDQFCAETFGGKLEDMAEIGDGQGGLEERTRRGIRKRRRDHWDRGSGDVVAGIERGGGVPEQYTHM